MERPFPAHHHGSRQAGRAHAQVLPATGGEGSRYEGAAFLKAVAIAELLVCI